MKIKYLLFGSLLTLGLLLVLLLNGFALAQGTGPDSAPGPLGPDAPSAISNHIPIQGRLTDASGRPLNGTYTLIFRLYPTLTGGTSLCAKSMGVQVTDGLFFTYLNGVGCSIDGRQLFLSIQVGDDPEMEPRQPVDNVPYAWTLRPGAVISGTLFSTAILHIENWGASGRGLRVYAMDETSTNYGIVGASRSSAGYGGFFYNNGGGVGLYASSSAAGNPALLAKGVDSGADIVLGGNQNTDAGDDGIITSDPDYASSDIVLKSNDTVRIDLNNDGSAEDADFEIHDQDDHLIFDVDDSGAVSYGGAGIAAFPRPAYDSGWQTLGLGATRTLTHNLGGNTDNYVVDLTCKVISGGAGVNNWGVGGDANGSDYYGAWWSNLTTSSIILHRWSNDTDCPNLRVRIWLYIP